MENNNLEEALKFYFKGANLKDVLYDEENDYSYADNIFGGSILATGYSSEFREVPNIGKMIRLMVLHYFKMINPDYDFKGLKKGKLYEEEMSESMKNSSPYFKLIFKYLKLDKELQNLIVDYRTWGLSQSSLDQVAIATMKRYQDQDEESLKRIWAFYKTNAKLKDKTRSGWDSNHWNIKGRRETVSEHIVGTLLLHTALSSDFDYNFNIDNVYQVLALHEVGESLIGDITPFDGITPEEKEKLEHKAMEDSIGDLFLKDYYLRLLFEFDKQKKKKMKYAHFIDKIEADLTSKRYQDKGLQNDLSDQNENVVMKSKKVQDMIENGAKTPFDIWYLWDKSIYEGDTDFPEFSEILNIINFIDINNIEHSLYKEEIKKRKLEK